MRIILLLGLLLATPRILAAQDPRLERLRQSFSAEAVAQIEGVLAQAESAGVPSDPLIAKALEGAAKGVPAERVVAALRSYAARLADAAGLVGGGQDASAIVVAADALRRGVPADAVRTLARERHRQFAVPVLVLGDLVEAGVPSERAYGVVQDALAQERTADELLAIPAAVRRLMREGQLPDEAAAAVGRMIGQGQFWGTSGPHGTPMMGPRSGPPVPPGSGPPEGSGKKGKGKGANSTGGMP